MAEHTEIQWADSTVNGEMGCDGCELSSNGGSGTCYAEVLTNFRKGNPGWPADFFSPRIFPGRIEKALRWPDLTGKQRLDKPWFDGLPRHVFLDDLGDTFTESLPLDWIAPHVPAMAASPHAWIFLTKRPERMAEFFRAYGSVPTNFLLGTSCIASTARVRELVKIKEGSPSARIWVSAEPVWRHMDFSPWGKLLSWIVAGGESGRGARSTALRDLLVIVEACHDAGLPCFVKQLGSRPHFGEAWTSGNDSLAPGTALRLRDKKGGDWSEWPECLRVRQPPKPMARHQGQEEIFPW